MTAAGELWRLPTRAEAVVYNLSMLQGREDARAEIERILESETFHSSVVLKRLLKFLADKTLSGEADNLNEYSVGVDGLGKPTNYDPRQDAIVRLHMGRIRQKLGDYYRNEGKNNPVVIEVPKGRFKLKWEAHSLAPVEFPEADQPRTGGHWGPATMVVLAALALSLCWACYSTVLLWRARQTQTQAAAWTPELEQLWRPFMDSKRPLMIAIADPLFFGFEGTDVYLRKIELRHPEDAR
jgi:hypothetical protein